MIRIPKDLQPYIEIEEGKVVVKNAVPKELKTALKDFKATYKKLQDNNPLTDF